MSKSIPPFIETFIGHVYAGSVLAHLRYDVPISALIAQSLIASQAGKTSLSRMHCNYFNLEAAPDWLYDSVEIEFKQAKTLDQYAKTLGTSRTTRLFRHYHTITESFLDFAYTLRHYEHYKTCFLAKDETEFAYRMARIIGGAKHANDVLATTTKYRLRELGKWENHICVTNTGFGIRKSTEQ